MTISNINLFEREYRNFRCYVDQYHNLLIKINSELHINLLVQGILFTIIR